MKLSRGAGSDQRKPRDGHDWKPLQVETFSSARGGNVFYKAISHPLAAERIQSLISELAPRGPIALYDPEGRAAEFTALFDMSRTEVCGAFAQRIEDLGKQVCGHSLRPVTELASAGARMVFVPGFDTGRSVSHLRMQLPSEIPIVTLDSARLPDALLSDQSRYLAPVNFATNFAFFREDEGLHTRLVTSNYWARYGAAAPGLWCRLFDLDGTTLATWTEELPADGGTVVIDSRDIRDRFALPAFAGQLFVHATGIAGHDVVKYALDSWADELGSLSCSHDANAWPSDRYAGLPAPAPDETVVLWIQNSHPRPIPAGAIGLAPMGSEAFVPLNEEVAPYGSLALNTRTLLPDTIWPQQIEIRAGKHAVRPRYEVRSGERRLLAHVNVERNDLAPDAAIRENAELLGKGYILPAPILPRDRWRSFALPTPMALSQRELPISAILYDADGTELARQSLGRLPRHACPLIDLDPLLADCHLPEERPWGHMELVYDFSGGGDADGWLHAIFRYTDRTNGHTADTSFGSHIFNTLMTFRGEPQSYSGPPPGLSTRLFVRLAHPPFDTIIHLIYPASRPWRPRSETQLVLVDRYGRDIAERRVEIPCSGSRFLRDGDLFDADERARAGADAHLIIRDSTCRLFGYHGLVSADEFALDHMFGA